LGVVGHGGGSPVPDRQSWGVAQEAVEVGVREADG
jgi:hypothetical protein